mmetsp:Transcript_29149/g.25740  ORF Transcript_29149/g.25740 Transcript_29149/m.25740 type:complete len:496 (+) Transcript_29149:47-1534(+)
MDELDQPSGYLQTAVDNKYNNLQNGDNLLDDDHHGIEPSETDILAKYQQRHNRRPKGNGYHGQRPTKRGFGELSGNPQSLSSHPSCFRESLYILFAWLGYFIHITFALIPSQWFGAKISTTDFYDNNSIEIAPASWNVIQWGIQILWQGILLTYLSLIAAEHTIKIFDKGFYYSLGIANMLLAIWDICTQQEFYLGRAISWSIIGLCLVYTNYVILKHVYFTYDVTKWILPSRFRLDSIPSNRDLDIDHDNNQNGGDDDINPPPLTINANTNTSLIKETTTTSRNIKSILRIQNGGSLNNSPVSMSMAPSAAEKFVYDAAEMAANTEYGDDWLQTKITDLTRIKYTGLIGIVFNGTSYFLSVVLLNFWVQMGVWLVYECAVPDRYASIVSLIMIFITILIYYYLDFFYYEKYFIDNFATHLVFCITFAAMVWRHLFGDHKDENKYEFSVILQIIIFIVVLIVAIYKTIKTIGVHQKYKRQSILEEQNQYQRVIAN